MGFRTYISKLIATTKNSIKECDLFTQNIMFTYKGKRSFSTFIGGFVSLLIIIALLVYLGILLDIMANRK